MTSCKGRKRIIRLLEYDDGSHSIVADKEEKEKLESL